MPTVKGRFPMPGSKSRAASESLDRPSFRQICLRPHAVVSGPRGDSQPLLTSPGLREAANGGSAARADPRPG